MTPFKINPHRLGVIFATLLTGILVDVVAAHSVSIAINEKAEGQATLASLADGKYQFCTKPDPKDWRVGDGVCLNFSKMGSLIDGYYGYPHTDNFICLKGEVNGNQITGQALGISWAMNQVKNSPQAQLTWDAEGHLTLSKGTIVRTMTDSEMDRTINWVLFPKASLDANGFYRYSAPRMSPPSQLCDWNRSSFQPKVYPYVGAYGCLPFQRTLLTRKPLSVKITQSVQFTA